MKVLPVHDSSWSLELELEKKFELELEFEGGMFLLSVLRHHPLTNNYKPFPHSSIDGTRTVPKHEMVTENGNTCSEACFGGG